MSCSCMSCHSISSCHVHTYILISSCHVHTQLLFAFWLLLCDLLCENHARMQIYTTIYNCCFFNVCNISRWPSVLWHVHDIVGFPFKVLVKCWFPRALACLVGLVFCCVSCWFDVRSYLVFGILVGQSCNLTTCCASTCRFGCCGFGVCCSCCDVMC